MSELRKQAEIILKLNKPNILEMSGIEMQNLIEELQIHQIELQIQNEELRNSRIEIETAGKKYFNLFDLAPIGYLIVDDKAIIQELNLKASEILGRRKDHTVNRPFIALLEASFISQFYENFEYARKKLLKDSFELKINSNDAEIYIEVSISVFTVATFLISIIDITERKNSQAELQRSEELHRTIISNISDAVFITDTYGNFTFICPNTENIFGYTWNEVKQKSNISFLLGENLFNKNELSEKKELPNIEKTIIDKYGNYRWLIINAKEVEIGKGTILYSCRDITERRNTNIALKQSLEKYQLLFEFMPVGISVADKDGNLMQSNKEAERILGIPKTELNKRTIDENSWRIIRKDSSIMPSEEFASVRALKENRLIENVEMGILKDKDSITWLTVNAVPDILGQAVIISYIDITEKIIKEQQLLNYSENLKKLSIAVEQSPLAIAITDTRGKIEYVNPEFSRSTGYSFEEAIGANPRILKSNKTPLETYKQLWNTIKSGDTWKGEFINKTKTGEIYYEEAIIAPLKNEDNKITNFITVKKDVTEKKHQEELILLNNQRLQKLLALSQMKETDLSTIIENALEIAIQLTKSTIGYIYHYSEDKKQFVLNSWSKGVMKECNIKEQATLYDLDSTGIWGEAVRQRKPIIINDFEVENPLKKGYPEGHSQLKRFLTIPVFSAKEIVAVIGVGNKTEPYDEFDIMQLDLLADSVWSISRQKDDEQKLRKYAEELKELNATKDKFFSIIAHDLKNPFNTILGFSELLIKNYEKYDKEKIYSFATRIHNAADNTFKLLENLLEWARIQRGVMPYNPEILNLSDVITNIFSIYNEQALAKQITLNWFSPETILVKADAAMIKTIFRNLISNALKFSHPNSNVFVYVTKEKEMIEIVVSDTGVGMNEETINNLFNLELNKSQTGTANEKGTGLGLILCKEFVEKHGGKLWVESKLDKGSEFKFTLPLST